ncbi:nuclear transport factor 2 family protein [Mycobacterium sp. PSTR-4-N]|uniref:nuclear transport factor 2 family protein n=1 Tax=Mycobacterium sp. PSTR-4-N TaxID=2917745 RepID=UPI001F14D75B|nr:nuclear transport factor 2 family protein [Mycobacterium sp. PSTR-4-N]MCG7595236.1 nuclear transport factor 2 family protein [Mycobacterium sp. PSTR-4-N]
MTDAQGTASQVVQNYFDVFFSHDVDKTLQCLTDDVVWRVQGAPDVPTIGTRYGKDEVREWLELFPHHFQPLDFDIQRMVADDDRVIVIGHFTHRILDTGREFSSDFATICTVRDGKLAAYNFLEDSYGLWDAFQPVDS